MRGQQGGSDENVLLPESPAAPSAGAASAAAAAEPSGGKHHALTRRTSAVLLERLNHDDEYRSATTSDTTGGHTVAGGTDAALLGASSASLDEALDEDGSVVLSNGSYVLTRTKSRDSASPLPNSGDTIPVDDDTRLWFGDRSRMERIVSFQRSSSGRHGISQTSSGLLIRHPIVLTGPSPSKDDDSSAGTLTADSNQRSSRKHNSARAVLSFGSSPSSSDVEARRHTSSRTKRRHHRARRGTPPPTIQTSTSLQDVLSAVGVTDDVPESLIFTVLSPTHIESLDSGTITDALSTDDNSSSTSSTSLDSSSSSSSPRSARASPVRVQVTPSPGPHAEQSPKRRLSPHSPPVSPAPRTPSPPGLSPLPLPTRKTSPTNDLTHVTVDDRRERIVSMKTSKSGRHTITQTETGKVITQPVFFSPGGVVMTESVPIYEAEEATTIASVAARTSAHRVRGRNTTNTNNNTNNNNPTTTTTTTTNNLSTSPMANAAVSASAAASAFPEN